MHVSTHILCSLPSSLIGHERHRLCLPIRRRGNLIDSRPVAFRKGVAIGSRELYTIIGDAGNFLDH